METNGSVKKLGNLHKITPLGSNFRVDVTPNKIRPKQKNQILSGNKTQYKLETVIMDDHLGSHYLIPRM